jgi:hypothetical protein
MGAEPDDVVYRVRVYVAETDEERSANDRLPHEKALRSLELFGREVVPQLR